MYENTIFLFFLKAPLSPLNPGFPDCPAPRSHPHLLNRERAFIQVQPKRFADRPALCKEYGCQSNRFFLICNGMFTILLFGDKETEDE